MTRTVSGSSPHTRGTLFRFTMAIAHVRFIPAYAGNTQTGRVDTSSRTGSSPHTRGTPQALAIFTK